MTALAVALALLAPITTDNEHRALEQIAGGATATMPAVRLNPPVVVAVDNPPIPRTEGLNGLPFAPAEWNDQQRVAFYIQQWALPATFMWLAYRESRYRNDVRTWCCYGIWQNFIGQDLRDHRAGPRIRNECQVYGAADIYGLDPLQEQKQSCVTAVMYSINGLDPWQ